MSVRYRRLTHEELGYLEKEFIDFLVVNGVTAEDWVKMKDGDKIKAEGMIEVFSNTVFDKILGETAYLEHRTEKGVYCFFCRSDKILLAGIELPEGSTCDLWDNAYIQQLFSSPPKGIQIFQTEKEYAKTRTEEIFELTQKGARITDGQLFKQITLASIQ